MKSERVLLTGAGGMLGNAVYPYFSGRYAHVCATDKDVTEPWLEHLDVRDGGALRRRFEALQPGLVLHLAACTDLEFCEAHERIAEETNAAATREVAALCEEFGATLVYISTAGVFDGSKEGFYTEQDEPSPIMVYGRTKRDGEIEALTRCSRHFVVRAGWMVGGGAQKDKKFVHHMLGQILSGAKVLHAVNDRWGTPTYTHDFALNLFKLLDSGRYGTYHMVCEGSGTRYDVAKAILEDCGRTDIELRAVSSTFFERNYFAPRPVSEMLVNANLSGLGLNLMRPWRQALSDYISREFPHARAGDAPDAAFERRRRVERRQQAYAWNAPERRRTEGRRASDVTARAVVRATGEAKRLAGAG